MTIISPTAMESTTSEPITVPSFAVISGAQVQHALQGRENQIVELVEAFTSTWRLAITCWPDTASMSNTLAVVIVSIVLIENAAPSATATPT